MVSNDLMLYEILYKKRGSPLRNMDFMWRSTSAETDETDGFGAAPRRRCLLLDPQLPNSPKEHDLNPKNRRSNLNKNTSRILRIDKNRLSNLNPLLPRHEPSTFSSVTSRC